MLALVQPAERRRAVVSMSPLESLTSRNPRFLVTMSVAQTVAWEEESLAPRPTVLSLNLAEMAAQHRAQDSLSPLVICTSPKRRSPEIRVTVVVPVVGQAAERAAMRSELASLSAPP